VTTPPWPSGAAWIGGRYCAVEDAKISVLDLGITRSDAAYDVAHVWRGRFYRLDDHKPLGTGAAGPLTTVLRDRYWRRHEDPRFTTPVRYDDQV
jgi:hypothetical protein